MPDHLPQIYQVEMSAHAIERFRERVFDASDETVRAYVLTPAARAWLAAGATAINGHNGLRIYAKHGVVTTVTPDHWPPTFRRNKHGHGDDIGGRPVPETERPDA